MLNLDKVKGIIFDYGGTIDSNGKHWAEVIWDAYVDNQVPVEKSIFRDAYIFAERYLAQHPVIKPEYNFLDLLKTKIDLQVKWLIENAFLPNNDKSNTYSLAISNQCYTFVRSILKNVHPILEILSKQYPMVLVSNFYGNISTILEDFDLIQYFNEIIESAVVGVRKPDPAIFALGVETLKLPAENIVVIGDSYTKDIIPASKVGCQTIWIKGPGWEEEKVDATADAIIYDFSDLKNIFQCE